MLRHSAHGAQMGVEDVNKRGFHEGPTVLPSIEKLQRELRNVRSDPEQLRLESRVSSNPQAISVCQQRLRESPGRRPGICKGGIDKSLRVKSGRRKRLTKTESTCRSWKYDTFKVGNKGLSGGRCDTTVEVIHRDTPFPQTSLPNLNDTSLPTSTDSIFRTLSRCCGLKLSNFSMPSLHTLGLLPRGSPNWCWLTLL